MHHQSHSFTRTLRHTPARFAGLLLLLLILAACGGSSTPPPKPSPTSTLAPNGFTPFKLGLPAVALNAPVKGPLPDSTSLHVGITFKTNQAVLDKLNKSGKGTNLEVNANQLGISDQLYQQIKTLFGITGARIKLDGLHTYLTVDAKASTFAQVFQTSFVLRTLNGRTFFAPTSDPKLPNFIAPSVLAITGLDNFAPPPQPGISGRGLAPAPFAANQRPQVCTPTQSLQYIAHAYGYDQLWKQGWHGEGMTLNLLELGPINQQELQYFGDCVHFQGQLKTVDVNGGPDPQNPADADSEGEAMLDIEMVQAMAPAATIIDYQSTDGNVNTLDDAWTNYNDILRQMISDNEKQTPAGSVVSISYGGAEAWFSDSQRLAIDQSLTILTKAEHMTVFVDSGDCGAFDGGEYGTLAVHYPASSPWVVGVGGTSMAITNNSARAQESAWSWVKGATKAKCDNMWGSGGGNSAIYPRPDWQKAPGVDNQYSKHTRQVPDISAVASPDDLWMYYQAQWITVGGTSAATPIWATGLMLANQGLLQQTQQFAFGPSIFYTIADDKADQPYYDVTQGDNLYYKATPGWDYATGLGTPNLPGFYNALLALIKQSS